MTLVAEPVALSTEKQPRVETRHGANLLVHDEIGVVLLCRCGRWGIATGTVERAEQAYSTEHLAEMGFRYIRETEDND